MQVGWKEKEIGSEVDGPFECALPTWIKIGTYIVQGKRVSMCVC